LMHIKGAAVGAVYDERRISFGCPMKPTPAWLPYAFVGGLLLLFLTGLGAAAWRMREAEIDHRHHRRHVRRGLARVG